MGSRLQNRSGGLIFFQSRTVANFFAFNISPLHEHPPVSSWPSPVHFVCLISPFFFSWRVFVSRFASFCLTSSFLALLFFLGWADSYSAGFMRKFSRAQLKPSQPTSNWRGSLIGRQMENSKETTAASISMANVSLCWEGKSVMHQITANRAKSPASWRHVCTRT